MQSKITDTIMRVLDNSAPRSKFKDAGLFHFGKHFFPRAFRNNFADHHYDIAQILWSMYNPSYTERGERQRFVKIHREAAKTTFATFLFPLFQIYLKGWQPIVRFQKPGWEGGDGVNSYDIIQLPPLDERFIMICSETGQAAENFTMNIKTVIEERTDLTPYFGDKHPKALDIDEAETRKGQKMWRRNAFITADNTIVYGLGTGQQVRGKNVNNTRPTLVLVDDMYSKESVKTEIGRDNLDQWFFNDMLNSIDALDGKICWLGTLLHEDTVIVKMEKDSAWQGISRPIISPEELEVALKHCEFIDDEMILPSKTEFEELQKTFTTLSWPDRHSLSAIIRDYRTAWKRGKLRGFYQEKLNESEAPEDRKIRAEHIQFRDMEVYYDAMGMACVKILDEGLWYHGYLDLQAGIDIAAGESTESGDTVIGATSLSRCSAKIPGSDRAKTKVFPIILHIEGGKYDLYEDDQIQSDRRKTGLFDAMIRLGTRMPFLKKFRFEVAGQQAQLFREGKRHARNKQMKVPIHEVKPTNQKETRIESIILPLIQKYGAVYVNNTCALAGRKFQSQLVSLWSVKFKDYPDALAHSFEDQLPTGFFQVYADQRYIKENQKNYKSDEISAAELWEVI